MQHPSETTHWGILLDDDGFSADELAQALGVVPRWVHAHVDAGVLHPERSDVTRCFGSVTLIRARRIAELEASFDADPQLAALTADLIEQVARLRQRLQALGVDDL